MKTLLRISILALVGMAMINAALVQGLPTAPAGSPANPAPRFGTLIDFDDQATGTVLAAGQYTWRKASLPS